MKLFISLLLTLSFYIVGAQTHEEEIIAFQQELNLEFLDPEISPLTKKERKKFEGHNFFPVHQEYRVEARFVKHEQPSIIQMETSTTRISTYDKYGEATFELAGNTYTLNIYQSHRLRETQEYKDYLFLPFTDLTNSQETYGGGRYIDLSIPDGDTIIIDFNKAYSPSCAYSHKYSCPVPPAENDLNTKVEAGVKNLTL